MTDEPKTPPANAGESEKSDVEKLRDEFTAQFSTLKQSFETELNALKTENTSLKETNDELRRALVRSATTTPPAPAEQPKTEEQLYQEKIAELSKRTLERMSKI